MGNTKDNSGQFFMISDYLKGVPKITYYSWSFLYLASPPKKNS